MDLKTKTIELNQLRLDFETLETLHNDLSEKNNEANNSITNIKKELESQLQNVRNNLNTVTNENSRFKKLISEKEENTNLLLCKIEELQKQIPDAKRLSELESQVIQLTSDLQNEVNNITLKSLTL
eukprot:TRINITY_DN5177_c0_g1_i1.p2 TRINITY_DN5177_c0_g1~~TRINITY_DN5177_c0_g1_i1.p2  ORF type:complete len:126 (+),score=24.51 TRINITY_DN5177_c0_g1_i1:171-548(+)